ncbi:MAG TPA: LanC-like protein [Gaiellaceae bacterium]|nr:LanC-like protein [Gaiellaceae bacterium]
MTLYRPEAFDRLTDARWDEARVRDRIRAIVADTDAGWRGPKLFWKANAWDRWQATSPLKSLYVGGAGVLWGLDQLRRRAYAETRLDLAELAARNVDVFRARPDFIKLAAFRPPEPRESALFLGEAGILLVAYKLGNQEYLDDLRARLAANVDNEAEEVFWGAPGSLLAAAAIGDEASWRTLADALRSRRDENGLWTQHLYGQEYQSLTPPHGLVGIVQALGDEIVTEDARRILRETAHREDGLANWPPRPRPELASPDGEIRLQWCAGAPGIVIGAADYLDEDLLLAGAELVWQAGPHGDEKGANICHGTAGNGYALLKTFERTGDERWLARARRFAVHALEQVERMPPRYSLFTGGLGAAIFAADCIDARPRYPIMEYI